MMPFRMKTLPFFIISALAEIGKKPRDTDTEKISLGTKYISIPTVPVFSGKTSGAFATANPRNGNKERILAIFDKCIQASYRQKAKNMLE